MQPTAARWLPPQRRQAAAMEHTGRDGHPTGMSVVYTLTPYAPRFMCPFSAPTPPPHATLFKPAPCLSATPTPHILPYTHAPSQVHHCTPPARTHTYLPHTLRKHRRSGPSAQPQRLHAAGVLLHTCICPPLLPTSLWLFTQAAHHTATAWKGNLHRRLPSNGSQHGSPPPSSVNAANPSPLPYTQPTASKQTIKPSTTHV